MKSKNLVLMVVAVGCGLVAAYLTAKLSGGSTEYVDVLVAKTQLVQGTEIKSDKEGLEKQIAVKRFVKGTEPTVFIHDIDDLKGKKLNKTIREGDHFTTGDLTGNKGITLPKGHTAMAIKVTADSTAGQLILPGSRVHVLLAEDADPGQKSGKTARIVLSDMLVVAVNQVIDRPEGSVGVSSPTTVTLAVTPKEGAILALAQKRGDLSLMLRDPKEPPLKDDAKAGENAEEQTDIGVLTSLPGDKRESNHAAPPTLKTVDVWVAKNDLPAGTKIEDPTGLFEKAPMLTVPENAVTDISDLRGKTLYRPLAKHQFVPLAALEKPADKPEEKKEPVVQAPPLGTLTIISGQNARTFAYNRDTSELLDVGGPGGTSRPSVEEKKPEPKPEPTPAPAAPPATKPEPKPEEPPAKPEESGPKAK